MPLRKGFRSYRRWDIGPVAEKVYHPLSRGYDLAGSVFSLAYDKVWEFSMLAHDEWYLTTDLWWESGQAGWEKHADDVVFWSGLGVEHSTKEPLHESAFQDCCWTRDRVLVPTLKWIQETSFREPVPARMRLGWLVDGSVRWDMDKTPTNWEDFPDQCARNLVDKFESEPRVRYAEIAEGVAEWLKNRRVSRAEYEDLAAEYR